MSTRAVTDKERIQLGKIEVRMGNKIVELSVEQARELCALLKGLFGDDTSKIVHVHDYWYCRPWYMGPTWTYTGSNWTATVDNNSSGTAVYTLSLNQDLGYTSG